jgi:hypothetical protein
VGLAASRLVGSISEQPTAAAAISKKSRLILLAGPESERDIRGFLRET